jgi:membrane protein DedA with SNARE-associated domain
MDWHALLATYGYPAVFLGAILEGEVTLLLAAFLAYRGYLQLPLVIGCAFAATFVADQFFFHLGRHGGRALLDRKPEWKGAMARARRFASRYPHAVVLSFRFAWGLRTVTPLLLGMSGFPPRLFLLLDALGVLLWCLVFSGTGYFLGRFVEPLISGLGEIEATFLAILAAVAAVLALWHVTRERHPPG